MDRGPWMGLQNTVDPHVVVLGIPYDGSISHDPGAAGAPAVLRALAADSPSWTETGRSFAGLRINDAGDVPVLQEDDEATQAAIRAAIAATPSGTVALSLGGDHSISAACASSLPVDGRLGVLWFDAHPDLMDSFRGIRGKRESRWNHACPLRRILELENVDDGNVVIIGPRDFLPEEIRQIRTRGLQTHWARELAALPTRDLAARIVDAFADVDQLYISFDIDVLDPGEAPGTGVPIPGGLSMRYVLDLFHHLIEGTEAGTPLLPPIAGFDLVEISPPADINLITARAGMAVLIHTLGRVAAQRGLTEDLLHAPQQQPG